MHYFGYTIISVLVTVCLSLTDVTDKVFGGKNQGIIAAFGDFNADKHTDIFVISEDGTSLFVYLADIEKEFTQRKLLDTVLVGSSTKISGVVPADFNGDLQMDVLVSFQKPSPDNVMSQKIYWGKDSGLNTASPLILPSMVDQPLLMDENADMIPDLFGEKSPGDRYYWLLSRNNSYIEKKVPGGPHAPLKVPQSSAFVDLNQDLTADVCVVSMATDGKPQLEKWINKDGVLTMDGTPVSATYDTDLSVVGQFTFLDIDGDLTIDVLVPACLDTECKQSLLLLYPNIMENNTQNSDKKWIKLPIDLSNSELLWNFIPQDQTGAPGHIDLPITLRVGDFNLDGFPDLLAVLGNATGNLHRAVMLRNVGCSNGCGGFSRTFTVDWSTWLEGSTDKALVPAFYDLYDNGILDVIVSSINSEGKTVTRVNEHNFLDDACFVKVTVVSGLCNYDCPAGRMPYGVNQPGPVIKYSTTDVNGNKQQRAVTQLTQSAYMSLQLPYSIFGLGQIPNFIDTLEVGIPTNSSTKLSRSWTSVIPNSQLLIIPYPILSPSSWTNKLFVMPSHLMMLTGAALLGTCGFIAGIVGILHWRDRIEDRKEKRQEAQKFHFDAM